MGDLRDSLFPTRHGKDGQSGLSGGCFVLRFFSFHSEVAEVGKKVVEGVPGCGPSEAASGPPPFTSSTRHAHGIVLVNPGRL